ncbi:hypothetical protein PVAND_010114 [Polypedilum vanderplanki]|uniref:Uncharacterized protein n=1 Tax=Polypedilum vanderplanki TaxID=319348 RepID=A0A9J6CEV7_POLVA|nr:hypothetical protein PVAND_010114 [Polypedilum vanderplanki]
MLRQIYNIKHFSIVNIRTISNYNHQLCKDFNDQLTRQSFKSNASDSLKILETSQLPELLHGLSIIKKNDIESDTLAQVFKKIFDLYKGDYELLQSELIKSPGFKNCCLMLRFHAPRMSPNDLVTCLKVLVSLKLNSHNKLIQQILHHIKDEINDLSIHQLAFVNYLLSKMEKTPLVSALEIAIPIVFNMNISMQLDHDNPDELCKLLKHVTESNLKISKKSVTNILTALTLHGTSLSLNAAHNIIWSLTSYNAKFIECSDIVDTLIQNCIFILNSNFNEDNFLKMQSALVKLTKKFKFTNLSTYYNETFFNNCVKHVINYDLGFNCAYRILRRLNDINFVSYDLLNYIDQKIIENHTHLSTLKMRYLMTLISAFSTANYKTDNWEILKSIILENPILLGELDMRGPILKFIVELLSLDFVPKIFFDRVLEEHFLAEMLNQNSSNNFANFPQLRLINQALTLLYKEHNVKLPDKMLMDIAIDAIPKETALTNDRLINLLETIFGTGTIQTNVQTKHGHLLEYVISFDKNQKAVIMPCKIKYFEDLPKSQIQSVAINFYMRKSSPINYPTKLRGIMTLRKKTLEAIGIKEVDLALHSLELLPENEKNGYVEREIRYVLEN